MARRLALLSAELASVRPPESDGVGAEGDDLAAEGTGAGGDPDWPWAAHTRIRSHGEGEPWGSPAPLPAAEVGQIPTPGRHAARRGRGQILGSSLEGLRGRVHLHPVHLTVVALAVCLGLGWTCWWLVGGRTESVSMPPVVPVAATASAPGAASAESPGEAPLANDAAGLSLDPTPGSVGTTTGSAAEVTVDVAGKVRRPGIVVLPAGSRVVDALEAAGGARPGVDLTPLNLARVLVDGEQVLVGVRPAMEVGTASGDPGSQPGALVNLNTADQATLETLPGVGPVTATAILAWRTEHGGFTAVRELVEVDGIGEATLAKLTPLVTL